ncbi:MAG TPA: PASTA domain-containing protein [Yinghuangia sp.]|nr:PASTA domain-containing protein [Yinghuangia sp.]
MGTYCPGNHCGADLLGGDRTGVQAWCEPERQRGEPRSTVTVRLVVRNAGARPDTFRVEPVERVHGSLDFDASVLNFPLAPDQTRVVEVRYTLPRDHTRLGIDVASRFGVPGADAAGRVNDGRTQRFGVALRVVSTTANQGAACAAFAVDVPRRFDADRPDGFSRARSVPLLVGSAVLALIVAATAVVAVTSDDGDSASAPRGDAAQQVPVGDGATAGVILPGITPSGGEPPSAAVESPSKGAGRQPPVVSSTATSGASGKSETVVPETVGLDVEAARQALRERNLVPRVQVRANSKGPKGEVLESSPAAGETVREGATVTITVRDGNTTVPEVVGSDEESATAEIRAAGLAVSVKPRLTSKADEYGVVVATYPSAGAQVPLITSVTIYVGKPDVR